MTSQSKENAERKAAWGKCLHGRLNPPASSVEHLRSCSAAVWIHPRTKAGCDVLILLRSWHLAPHLFLRPGLQDLSGLCEDRGDLFKVHRIADRLRTRTSDSRYTQVCSVLTPGMHEPYYLP